MGRLDEQKGMHLVHHALFHTLAHGGQFVLLGHAHHYDGVNGHSWQLKHYLDDSPDCHLEIGYQEELAHQVHAGADLVVVPSMFEPCGLAPMTAMRYGTVAVVRTVGGMIDTVFDRDYSARPPWERNGYVPPSRQQGLESALHRAGTVVRVPGRVPPAHRRIHAVGLLVGPARPGLPEHLRLHPPQVSPPGQTSRRSPLPSTPMAQPVRARAADRRGGSSR